MATATPSHSAAQPPHPTGACVARPRLRERRLSVMTWLDVADALNRGHDRVVVPFGAIEQHSSHLPLQTDALLGDHLGPLLAERLDALCAPTVQIGCSEHHMARAGTLSLRPETLRLIVRDVVESLARHGFRTIVLVPTHAGNAAPLAEAARIVEPPRGARVVAVADIDALARALRAVSPPDRRGPVDGILHAGEIETSLMLAIAPAAVRAPSREPPVGHGDRERSPERAGNETDLPIASGEDALRATEAAGRTYIAAFLSECVRQLEDQGVRSCISA